MSASGTVKRLVRALARYAGDPVYRESLRLARARPGHLFQPHGWTRAGRYPRIFRAARNILGDGPGIRILSFGCATGEEVATLRRRFPQAFIQGLDINPQSVAACRDAFGDAPAVAFAVADSTQGEAAGAYDAIFCMAVLRHGDLGVSKPERCDHLIRFADFERAIADFGRCLKPGGLLALRHSNFRLEDTSVAAQFEPLLAASRAATTPKYGPDDRRLPDEPQETALFRKRP